MDWLINGLLAGLGATLGYWIISTLATIAVVAVGLWLANSPRKD